MGIFLARQRLLVPSTTSSSHISDGLTVEGARQNNLKNISLRIPHNQVTVISGVSGSGKSSLAFDTLFAEGQWRYVESLSTYARMFLDKVNRPDVDRLLNVRPAIAIEQKNPIRTARSTVATTTEIADLLRLLFAKVGHPVCPDCAINARSFHPGSVADDLLNHCANARAMILFSVAAPAPKQEQAFLQSLLLRGFTRVRCGMEILDLHENHTLPKTKPDHFEVILDRLVIRDRKSTR